MFTISRRFAIAATLATSLMSAPVLAQELTATLKKIKETGVISLGHRESSIPFSYYDEKQQVVGYSQDMMLKAVEAIKTELKLTMLDIKLLPVTSENRIMLVENGIGRPGMRFDDEHHRTAETGQPSRTASSSSLPV
jgi:glutamate/aspartate transport system substrate-binding protein